jgi:hypothetical protein
MEIKETIPAIRAAKPKYVFPAFCLLDMRGLYLGWTKNQPSSAVPIAGALGKAEAQEGGEVEKNSEDLETSEFF